MGLDVPNSLGKKKSEKLGLICTSYKFVTKILSDTSESRLMVPPFIFKRHWLPVSAHMTSATTPGYSPIEAIRAQIFLSPVTLQTLTRPVFALFERGAIRLLQRPRPKQFLIFSAKQQPFFFHPFRSIVFSSY